LDQIGKVIHYYDKIGVAIIELEKGSLKVGQKIKFKQGEEEFEQEIASLEVDHKPVDGVKTGDAFGLKIDQPVKEGVLVLA